MDSFFLFYPPFGYYTISFFAFCVKGLEEPITGLLAGGQVGWRFLHLGRTLNGGTEWGFQSNCRGACLSQQASYMVERRRTYLQ